MKDEGGGWSRVRGAGRVGRASKSVCPTGSGRFAMKVLLTGHLGYIGTVLTPMLLAEGHDVAGLDSDLYRRCTFLERIAQVRTIRKDLRDIIPEDVRGFDAVLHLAALSNDPLGNLNPALTEDIN